jgi:hypothetical protein
MDGVFPAIYAPWRVREWAQRRNSIAARNAIDVTSLATSVHSKSKQCVLDSRTIATTRPT